MIDGVISQIYLPSITTTDLTIIIIIIIIIIITKIIIILKKETRKYWVDVQKGIVSSHGEKDLP